MCTMRRLHNMRYMYHLCMCGKRDTVYHTPCQAAPERTSATSFSKSVVLPKFALLGMPREAL